MLLGLLAGCGSTKTSDGEGQSTVSGVPSFAALKVGQDNDICAGVLITIIPALIVFLLCQDQIYSAMAAGAVKG